MKKKVFYLNFTPLGDYESLEYFFSTREEAEEKLRELEKEEPRYYAFIAKVLIEVKRTGEWRGEKKWE